jgi:cytochrome c551/c552
MLHRAYAIPGPSTQKPGASDTTESCHVCHRQQGKAVHPKNCHITEKFAEVQYILYMHHAD